MSVISTILAQKSDLPETGISGVYEVMVGATEEDSLIQYFQEFGFRVVDQVDFSLSDAERLYGVSSKLTSYRLQNGSIDSHGLVRVLIWENPTGSGVGYAPPETIGQRMAVMLTKDIFRLDDIYTAARNAGEPWLATTPVADDLFGLNSKNKSFFDRPVIVREAGVYGRLFNHVFFQRYGYNIPGYGTVGNHSKLKTSEFTHHDFIIKGDINQLNYLQTVLGLKSENPPEIDGDWRKGPKEVFQFKPGESHWYWGFVSPNNICGKLKFFVPLSNKLDRSEYQKPGQLGITLHSFYSPKLEMIHGLAKKHSTLIVTDIQKNEFNERCFNLSDSLGVSWQIIEAGTYQNNPISELAFELVDE